ncbi:MAG: hypothetical protein KGP34_06470, partial [Bacteroidetes bacterium]|nr:hypothetical protein [Bacteroidota bacterium]
MIKNQPSALVKMPAGAFNGIFAKSFLPFSFFLAALLSLLGLSRANAQTYPLRSIDSIQWVHPDTLLTGKTLSRYMG